MAARMLKVPTNRRQRELAPIALDLAKKLAQDVASGASRLGIPDGPANNVIGNLAYLRGELDKILPAEQGTKYIEIDTSAADVLKNAIRIWAAATLKKDHTLQLALGSSGKSAPASQAEKDMQELSDSVNRQLSLPFENISTLDDVDDEDAAETAALNKGTASGPHRGVGEKRKPEDTPAGQKWNRTHTKAGDAKGKK